VEFVGVKFLIFSHKKNFMSNFFLLFERVSLSGRFCKFIFFVSVLNSLIVTLKLPFILTPPTRYLHPIIPYPEKKLLEREMMEDRLELGAIQLSACGQTRFPKREGKKISFLPKTEICCRRIDRTVRS